MKRLGSEKHPTGTRVWGHTRGSIAEEGHPAGLDKQKKEGFARQADKWRGTQRGCKRSRCAQVAEAAVDRGAAQPHLRRAGAQVLASCSPLDPNKGPRTAP